MRRAGMIQRAASFSESSNEIQGENVICTTLTMTSITATSR
jgi:hypothetical protein